MFERIKNYFRPEIKSNSKSMVGLLSPQAWNPSSFDPDKAIKFYKSNPYVYRCIQLVARSCAKIPWLLYERTEQGIEEIYNHNIKALLRRPNPQEGQFSFVESLVTSLYLFGNAYIYAVRINGEPKELYLLPFKQVKINVKNGFIDNYEYNKEVKYKPEEICHIKLPNPLDPLYGLSPLEAISTSISLNSEAKQYNISLLKNSATPSGAVSIKNQSLSENEFTTLKSRIKEEYTGSNKAGNLLVFGDDIEWINLSQSLNDMEYTKVLSISAQEICNGLGVPSGLLVEANKTYDSAKQSRISLYTECVLPLLTLIRDSISPYLVDAPYYVDYDIDSVEALHEARAELVASLKDATWLTLDELREIQGYSPLPKDGDVVRSLLGLPVYAQALSSALPPPGGKSQTLPAQVDARDPDPKQIPCIASSDLPSSPDQTKLITGHFKTGLDQGKDRGSETGSDTILKARERHHARVKRAISSLLELERSKVNHALQGQVSPSVPLASITSPESWSTLLEDLYLSMLEDIGGDIYISIISLKSNDIPQNSIDFWQFSLREWLKKYAGIKIQQINNTTLEAIRSTLLESVDSGDNLQQTIDKIDRLYLDQIIPNRSEVITRTELVSASNLASLFVAKSTGLDLNKYWISTADKRTRGAKPHDTFSHLEMDGQTVSIDDLFVEPKTGELLLYPGDISNGASGGNIINCRCAIGYAPK